MSVRSSALALAGLLEWKKVCGNGDLLAVADSQVVVLHNVKVGMQQSYRLKGKDVSRKAE